MGETINGESWKLIRGLLAVKEADRTARIAVAAFVDDKNLFPAQDEERGRDACRAMGKLNRVQHDLVEV